jgi:hypothetical protein
VLIVQAPSSSNPSANFMVIPPGSMSFSSTPDNRYLKPLRFNPERRPVRKSPPFVLSHLNRQRLPYFCAKQ